MILPSKHLREDQALISIGAELLKQLDEPKTISRLWDDLQRTRERGSIGQSTTNQPAAIHFDWFILALDLLYLLGAIQLRRGRIHRGAP